MKQAPRFELLEPRCLLATTPFNIDDFPSLPATVDVGFGSLTTVLPAGEAPPTGSPNFIADHSGPVSAADWWSSTAFASNGGSFPAYAHPLAALEHADGLAVGYPRNATVAADDYRYGYSEDLRIGLTGLLASGGAEVASYSDWTVTLRWQDGPDRLEATIGHGLPFIFLSRQGTADAEVDFGPSATVWSNSNGVAGVTVGGKHYGVFAPSGAAWTVTGDTLRSDLNSADYFSVAVLPDNSQATLDFFRARAFAFVVDAEVSWQYDPQTSASTATYSATTQQQETGGVNVDQPLMALYRHQWLNSSDPLTAFTYESSRGQMKVLDGKSFSTVMTHHGVLPVLPELGADQAQLYSYIDQLYQTPNLLPTSDTYFTGVNMYKLAQLVPLAEQVGHIEARDRFLVEVRAELEDWFDATDGGEGLFYYDQDWNALIGYPDSFGSAEALNDHHFHYGYFIQSAAIVAMYDTAWAHEAAWGGMVELLIRDVANWERDDSTFEFLRNFDVYAGHGWASGNAQFARGNNQESSSEAMNFANGLVLWGSVTGDDAIRDVGVYLATNQQAAIEQYWLDVDNAVFPSGYQHPQAGIVWSDGGSYSTFFSGEPELIQGINYLPLNGGSLYLGHDPGYVQAAYQHIVSENGGPVDDWQDLMASYLAFADPVTALADFNANPTDAIQPLAKNYHWISALGALGQVDPSVTADIASYAVFDDAGVKSYVAYNPTGAEVTATYSDGTVVPVPAGTLVVTGGNAFSWAPDPSLTPTTPENRLFVRDQQSPTQAGALSLTLGSGAMTDELPGANGGVFFDTPVNPVTYTAYGITAAYDPSKQTAFDLQIDALSNSGNMTQARVSYDLEGDGQYDRIEVYGGFATDSSTGWELYGEGSGLVSATGSLGNLVGGRVRLEVWNVFGPGGVQVRTDAASGQGQRSFIDIPYNNVGQEDVLNVSVLDASVSENGGMTTVTVTRTGSTAASLDVTLTSNDLGEAFVVAPTTATIGVGQTSTTFNIDAVNDQASDGSQTVTLTASAAGFADATAELLVTDDETPLEFTQTLYLLDGAVAGGTVGAFSNDPGGGAASDLALQGSGNVGTPGNPLVYLREGLNAAYSPGEQTTFDLYLDAGGNVGDATQARVSYDFDGDGAFDRIETYNFFATNPVVDWERYRETSGYWSESGAFADLVNGKVRLELWKSFGGADVEVRTSATDAQGLQSSLSIPFQAQPFVAGDYNLDTSVNAADYVLFRDTLGQPTAPFASADGNGNEVIDPGDFDVWASNFGAPAPAPVVAAQAEPDLSGAGFALLLANSASDAPPSISNPIESAPADALSDDTLLLLALDAGFPAAAEAVDAETFDEALSEGDDVEGIDDGLAMVSSGR